MRGKQQDGSRNGPRSQLSTFFVYYFRMSRIHPGPMALQVKMCLSEACYFRAAHLFPILLTKPYSCDASVFS